MATKATGKNQYGDLTFVGSNGKTYAQDSQTGETYVSPPAAPSVSSGGSSGGSNYSNYNYAADPDAAAYARDIQNYFAEQNKPIPVNYQNQISSYTQPQADPNKALIADLQAQIAALTAMVKTPQPYPVNALSIGPAGQSDWFEDNPSVAYYNKLGIPMMGTNPFQDWLGNQYQNSFGNYKAKSFFNTDPNNTPSWENYLSGGQTASGNYAGEGWDLFKQALGLPADNTEGLNQNQFVTTLGDAGLSGLMENVLSKAYGRTVGRSLAANTKNLYSEYQGQNAGQGNSFLSYLAAKYNLQGLS